jgi:hypothetical protein
MTNIRRLHSCSTYFSTSLSFPNFLDSTPTLSLYLHSLLPQPLTTILDLPNIILDAWISHAEPPILCCISDANDDHAVQTDTIDDYFLRRRDGEELWSFLGQFHGAPT